MNVPSDYMVRCPQCDSDNIFTLTDSAVCQLPVRHIRTCRICQYKFYTKFDKISTDIVSLAEATTFKAVDDDVWTGLFVTGVFDTKEEAVQAQLEELAKECED